MNDCRKRVQVQGFVVLPLNDPKIVLTTPDIPIDGEIHLLAITTAKIAVRWFPLFSQNDFRSLSVDNMSLQLETGTFPSVVFRAIPSNAVLVANNYGSATTQRLHVSAVW